MLNDKNETSFLDILIRITKNFVCIRNSLVRPRVNLSISNSPLKPDSQLRPFSVHITPYKEMNYPPRGKAGYPV